jgi:hypothetical protein
MIEFILENAAFSGCFSAEFCQEIYLGVKDPVSYLIDFVWI